MGLPQLLSVGIPVAARLADLHERGAIHGALSPSVIVLDDAGGATLAPADPASTAPWIYRSPEQSGRWELPVDARSDLYALGVILYEKLVGALPFAAVDALEWTHSHLARAPRAPSLVVPSVPPAAADVVLKLLAKDPDDRYQTARGLLHDLERCREADARNELAPFALGQHDHSDRFVVPHKLYGRSAERAALREAFEAVRDVGAPRLVLLAGGPGVGKTALARDLTKPVAAAQGLFVAGKFDQFQRDVPYAPLVRAWGELIRTILTASEERVATWTAQVQDALGIHGRLITDLVPVVELLVGPQLPVEPLPPGEAHHRLAAVFRRFVGVFATREHPLVLFVDDLQWADAASFRLLTDLLTQPSQSLLVVGAYRDKEVDAAHPLSRMVEEVRAASTPVEVLAVSPLTGDALAQLVADTLHTDVSRCAELSHLIAEKTRGNPLFVAQLLATLHREGLLHFDHATHAWTWDVARIAAEAFSDDIVEMLTEHLQELPADTQHVLRLAACLGPRFDLDALAMLADRSRDDTRQAVDRALADGLVLRTADGLRFVHDRVQQAAYAGLDAADRARAHLHVGRTLLARTPADAVGERLFELVSHLNRGRALIEEPVERLQLARLELQAAQRARASAAYRAAADYCAVGLTLVDAERERALAFALSCACAECELASGEVVEAERRLEAARAVAQTRAERAACHRLAIDLLTARGESLRALDEAIACLAMYGIELVAHPTVAQVEAAEQALAEAMAGRAVEALVDLPLSHDVELAAAAGVLVGMLPSAYFADLLLHRLVACRVIELALRHGLSTPAVMGIAAYGFELSVRGRFQDADRYGQVAMTLVERHGLASMRAKIWNLTSAIGYWVHGLRSTLDRYRQGAAAGELNGDMIFAGLCRLYQPLIAFAASAPLEALERSCEEDLGYIEHSGFRALAIITTTLQHLISALRRDGREAYTSARYRALAEQVAAHPMPLARTWLHLYALEAHVLFGDTDDALEAMRSLAPTLVLLRGQYVIAVATFFGALAMTAGWARATEEQRAAWAPELAAHEEALRGWAALCPANAAAQAALVAAERARIAGRDADAIEQYDRALEAARGQGDARVEALVHERAAQFSLARGRRATAELHLGAAHAAYLRWGALAKTRALEEAWPGLRAPEVRPATVAPGAEGLDALALAKASQAISGEIVLERLLEKLLRVAIESSGARRGALLLVRASGLVVAATAAVEGESIAVTAGEPFLPLSSDLLPTSVVHYVRRTRTPVIVGNAVEHEAFGSDVYVVRRSAKSLLCVPVLRQAELQAIVYLENDLIAQAFTAERLTVLEVLMAQVAISLENATLYTDLRREIAERERTEAGLRASEAQLRQAQKMEAVGRLAGGIAHDFNNLLTAICGYSLVALEQLEPGHPIREDVEEIQRAGERAAALTKQLLAFSRQQVLQPRSIDLVAVVASVERTLLRLMGADIERVSRHAADLGTVRADPGQIEQIVLNLAVNARDAMPGGGTLTIETSNVELEARADGAVRPGRYVMLSVSDTGEGMDEATQAQIFEPFFTTKALGKGTGLGLSTVYGIVQQSGGHIEVSSALGRGTTFRIYLPRIDGPSEPIAAAAIAQAAPRGTETILLVEDDDAVRRLASDVLGALGYTVLVAADAAEAIRLHAAHAGPVNLLITDVVMPRMSGPELARLLSARVPALEILFVSGYAADAVVNQGHLHPDAAFLQKPFTPDALARKARATLDAGRRRGG